VQLVEISSILKLAAASRGSSHASAGAPGAPHSSGASTGGPLGSFSLQALTPITAATIINAVMRLARRIGLLREF
jgi:hypothetical protein